MSRTKTQKSVACVVLEAEDKRRLEAYAAAAGKSQSEIARQIFARGMASMAAIDQATQDGKKVIDLATKTWKAAGWLNGKMDAQGEPQTPPQDLETRLANLEKELAETRTALSKSQAATIAGVVAGLEPMLAERLNKIVEAALGNALNQVVGD